MQLVHTGFLLGTGLFWSVTYVLLIRTGLRERTFGMPVVAFATNISWEFMFAFARPPSGVMHVINIVWFCFDLAIGYTLVRFGRSEFPYLPERLFLPALAVLLALAYPGMNYASEQFDEGVGAITAFGSNLAMFGMFLAMLAARRGTRGQSVEIAVTKLLGTACASLSMRTDPDGDPRYDSVLMHYLYLGCLLLDLAYVYAVFAVGRAEQTGDSAGVPTQSALQC
ncbi:transmembrane-type terpene cyclase [Streptomyces sp. NPDC001450]